MAGPIARYFRFAERSTDLATELRAGLTTYMVMAYIIFVNPSVLGLVGVPGLEGKGLPFAAPLPVALGTFGGLPAVVFVLGFILTAWLMARRVRGALLLGIVLTTLLAIVLNGALASWQGFSTPGAARIPAAIVEPPDLSTVGRLDFGLVARLGVVTAVLVTFSIMLSDFFDTMGTIIGVGGKAGFLDARGRLAGVNRVLLVA